MKQYNDLNDIDRDIIREYFSWKKSTCNIDHKLAMLSYWRNRAVERNIDHLL